MQDLITFINSCGFPIFVAVVLLWKVDTMHAENIRAIHSLTDAISELRNALNYHQRQRE